ncbi:VOC family protein [Phenylobacterium sp.]|uniref:VOC family protein n=1 Tax=Phenylobacterium sp. TaxID=1871053 RepID=UPI00289A4AA3|nr:VOC family protein [Phenylobacterium sp.]
MSTIALERPQLAGCILRVARPTDRMEAVVGFYRDGLGFPELTRFADHDGFDGVILGFPGAPYHLEFTSARGRLAGRAPTRDNLLVLYMPDARAWSRMIGVMQRRGHRPVESANPYWDREGVTYEDPDGYRVVLHQGIWPV